MASSSYASLINMSNLTGLAFLHSDGLMVKNLASIVSKDMNADLEYIKLGSWVDG